MGMSEFYGTPDEAGRHRHHPPRPRPRRDLPRHRRHVRPLHQRAARRHGDRRPPRRGPARHQVRQRAPARRHPGRHQRPPRLRPRGLRRLAPAARRRPHRPLLPAPRRPDRPDRGDRRRDGRAGRGRQGPPPRPVRGVRRHHPRARTRRTRSPRCRPSTRCSPATSRTRSCRRSASSASAWCPTPRSAAACSPARSPQTPARDGEADRRRSAYFPRFQGEALDANLALVDQVRALADGEGLHARPARAGLGAGPGRRRRADPGHQAGARTSRRTSAPRTSRSPPTTWPPSRQAVPARRRGRRPLRRHVAHRPLSHDRAQVAAMPT